LIKEKRNGNCKEGYGQESGEEAGGEEGSREEGGGEEGSCKEGRCEEGPREEGRCEEKSPREKEEGPCEKSGKEKGPCEKSGKEKGPCEKSGEEEGPREEGSGEKAGCEEGSGGSGPGCIRSANENVTQPTSCLAVPDRRKALIGSRSFKTCKPGFGRVFCLARRTAPAARRPPSQRLARLPTIAGP
jgi:hypothetical protein